MSVTNILISGTGGQGIVLAGRIIASVAFRSGYDVKESEIHGMAQRGGSVVAHIRFGDTVYSPHIPTGTADIMVALEELEALRYIHYLKKSGLTILNKKRILPSHIKPEDYPNDIEIQIKSEGFLVKVVEAENIAKQLGNPKVENSVIIGVLSWYLPFDEKIWHEVISEMVPAKTVEINIKAFNEGRRLAGQNEFLEQTSGDITKGKT